jgi:hypothetical protein
VAVPQPLRGLTHEFLQQRPSVPAYPAARRPP